MNSLSNIQFCEDDWFLAQISDTSQRTVFNILNMNFLTDNSAAGSVNSSINISSSRVDKEASSSSDDVWLVYQLTNLLLSRPIAVISGKIAFQKLAPEADWKEFLFSRISDPGKSLPMSNIFLLKFNALNSVHMLAMKELVSNGYKFRFPCQAKDLCVSVQTQLNSTLVNFESKFSLILDVQTITLSDSALKNQVTLTSGKDGLTVDLTEGNVRLHFADDKVCVVVDCDAGIVCSIRVPKPNSSQTMLVKCSPVRTAQKDAPKDINLKHPIGTMSRDSLSPLNLKDTDNESPIFERKADTLSRSLSKRGRIRSSNEIESTNNLNDDDYYELTVKKPKTLIKPTTAPKTPGKSRPFPKPTYTSVTQIQDGFRPETSIPKTTYLTPTTGFVAVQQSKFYPAPQQNIASFWQQQQNQNSQEYQQKSQQTVYDKKVEDFVQQQTTPIKNHVNAESTYQHIQPKNSYLQSPTQVQHSNVPTQTFQANSQPIQQNPQNTYHQPSQNSYQPTLQQQQPPPPPPQAQQNIALPQPTYQQPQNQSQPQTSYSSQQNVQQIPQTSYQQQPVQQSQPEIKTIYRDEQNPPNNYQNQQHTYQNPPQQVQAQAQTQVQPAMNLHQIKPKSSILKKSSQMSRNFSQKTTTIQQTSQSQTNTPTPSEVSSASDAHQFQIPSPSYDSCSNSMVSQSYDQDCLSTSEASEPRSILKNRKQEENSKTVSKHNNLKKNETDSELMNLPIVYKVQESFFSSPSTSKSYSLPNGTSSRQEFVLEPTSFGSRDDIDYKRYASNKNLQTSLEYVKHLNHYFSTHTFTQNEKTFNKNRAKLLKQIEITLLSFEALADELTRISDPATAQFKEFTETVKKIRTTLEKIDAQLYSTCQTYILRQLTKLATIFT